MSPTTLMAAPVAPPLPLRRPAASGSSKRALDSAVRHRERAYRMTAWLMFTGGMMALLLGPAIVAALIVKFAWHTRAAIAMTTSFALASALFVPVLLWLERLTRGHWFEQVEQEIRYGAIASVPIAGVAELLLWGPRMIFAARDRWGKTVSVNVLTDAAATIAYLRHFADDGVGTHELPTLQPAPLLRYLVSREWVGVSEDGRRVWLLADARRALGFE